MLRGEAEELGGAMSREPCGSGVQTSSIVMGTHRRVGSKGITQAAGFFFNVCLLVGLESQQGRAEREGGGGS